MRIIIIIIRPGSGFIAVHINLSLFRGGQDRSLYLLFRVHLFFLLFFCVGFMAQVK